MAAFTAPKHKSYDVVIVGGAMFGSSVAWFLASNPDFDGSYSKEIDLTGNPEGVYILSISQNESVFTEKIIFNKQ